MADIDYQEGCTIECIDLECEGCGDCSDSGFELTNIDPVKNQCSIECPACGHTTMNVDLFGNSDEPDVIIIKNRKGETIDNWRGLQYVPIIKKYMKRIKKC